jgi:hypothetical protein
MQTYEDRVYAKWKATKHLGYAWPDDQVRSVKQTRLWDTARKMRLPIREVKRIIAERKA